MRSFCFTFHNYSFLDPIKVENYFYLILGKYKFSQLLDLVQKLKVCDEKYILKLNFRILYCQMLF